MQEADIGEELWEPLARAFLRGVEDSFTLYELRDALAIHRGKAPMDRVLGPWLREMGWERRQSSVMRTVWKRTDGAKPEYSDSMSKSLKRNT